MTASRRTLLSTAIAASGLLAAADTRAAPGSGWGRRRTFVLVHGSWNSSGVWERITHQLVAAGHAVVARDLPGRGLNALFPQSYFQRPLDAAAFSGEESPVGGVTLDQCVSSIAGDIRDAVSGGSGPVILVGHSSGGTSITPVAESYPQYVSDLVYVAGHMPAAGVTPIQDLFSDENDNNQALVPLFFGDPGTTGASRIDWRSADAAYLAALQDVLYGDADVSAFRAAANLLTPDDPVQPFTVPTAKTAQRWGSIRRSYIRTGLDHAVLPALQDRWIAQADALTPGNPTTVYPLASSHSPFISQPDRLVAILLEIAGR